jgi:hypothetical protein
MCSSKLESPHVYDSCQQAKSHQLPYPVSTSVSSKPLELAFSGVWGPAPDSVGRKKYYVSFIDDFSKFTCVYLLHFKSEVFQKFTEFQTMVERLFNIKLLAIQTDGGGEYQKMISFLAQKGIIHYLSCPHASEYQKMISFLAQKGIIHYLSCPHVHQQSGPAKRKHSHIVEVALGLLAQASMPLKFWYEAITTATYLINRTPSKVLNFATLLE